MSFLPEEFKGAIYKNVPRERVFSAGARRSPKTLDAWLNDIGGFENGGGGDLVTASAASSSSLEDILHELSVTEITQDEMLKILRSLPGKKMNWEHDTREEVGVVTGGRLVAMPDGTQDAVVSFKMYNSGKGKTIVDSWNATRGQAKRPMIGLSLAHNPETLEADHVAVVDVGRRSGALVYASAKREEVPLHFIPLPVTMSSALTSNPTPAPSPAAASASASGGQPTQPTFHGMPVANVDPTGNLNIDASSVNAKHSDLVRQHVMAAVAEERAEIETRLKTQQDTRFQEIQRMFEALKQAQRQSEMDEANKKVATEPAGAANPKKRNHSEATSSDSGRDADEKSTTPAAVTTVASSGFPDIDAERAAIMASNLPPGAKASVLKSFDQRIQENGRMSKEILEMRLSMVNSEDQDDVRKQTLADLHNRDTDGLRAIHASTTATKRKFESLEKAAADKAAAAAAAAASALMNQQAMATAAATAAAALSKSNAAMTASSPPNKDVNPGIGAGQTGPASSAASASAEAGPVVATSTGLSYNKNFWADMQRATGGDLSKLADPKQTPLILASNIVTPHAEVAKAYMQILDEVTTRTMSARFDSKTILSDPAKFRRGTWRDE